MTTLLWQVEQNTITVAVMIPFALFACRLFRDRPAVQHVFWLIILLKFVTPSIISWPWSVQQLGDSIWSTATSTLVVEGPMREPSVVETVLAEKRSGSRTRLPSEFPTRGKQSEAEVRKIDARVERLAVVSRGPEWRRIALHTAAITWIIGSAAALAWQLRRIIRLASLIRFGGMASEPLTREIQTIAKLMSLRPPPVVIVRGIRSPFVWCLCRLRLVWPESQSDQTEVVRLRGVIAHELAHVCRADHWTAWLELIAGVIWWWNPLCWFVRRRLRETAEMACDALAIATNPEGRREYAQLLLELSTDFQTDLPASVPAIGAGVPAFFERRLSMILSDRVSGKLSLRGLVATIGFALLTLPGCPYTQNHKLGPVTISKPILREVAPCEVFTGRLVNDQEIQNAAIMAQRRQAKLAGRSFPADWPFRIPLAIRFEMDERSYLRYQRMRDAGTVKGAGVPLAVGLSDETNFPHAGVLDRFEKEFNPTTNKIEVYGVLQRTSDLFKPGMFVRVRMTFGPPRPVVEVPKEWVHEEGTRSYLWVVNERNMVERRTVRTGIIDDGRQLIEEGLRPEEWVIITQDKYDIARAQAYEEMGVKLSPKERIIYPGVKAMKSNDHPEPPPSAGQSSRDGK